MNYGYNHGSQGDLMGLSSAPRREVSRDDLKNAASQAPMGTGDVSIRAICSSHSFSFLINCSSFSSFYLENTHCWYVFFPFHLITLSLLIIYNQALEGNIDVLTELLNTWKGDSVVNEEDTVSYIEFVLCSVKERLDHLFEFC